MNKAVIALGSNIQPRIHIEKAKKLIAGRFMALAESKFVQTKPIGYINQNYFTNGAVLIETPMNFDELNTALKEIETALGRKRGALHFGPRTIDLDIVVWNSQVIHRDFFERDFLKKSVLELLPDLKF